MEVELSVRYARRLFLAKAHEVCCTAALLVIDMNTVSLCARRGPAEGIFLGSSMVQRSALCGPLFRVVRHGAARCGEAIGRALGASALKLAADGHFRWKSGRLRPLRHAGAARNLVRRLFEPLGPHCHRAVRIRA